MKQLIDFARFLQVQPLIEEETAAEIEADNAEWDALLATDESQDLLVKLADEAIAEHKADKTKPMIFNNDGRIIPG